ncbi:MAG: DNA-protecting protein DprA [Gammaproteobacteria bacterium]|nr:DNA-protecting protein DprA [Gammaproteobacteria bacterium]
MADSGGEAQLLPWLTLLHTSGLGVRGANRLIHHYGSAAEAIRAGSEDSALSAAIRTGLKAPDRAGIERDLAWLQQPENHLLSRDDRRYPSALAEIGDPPLLLYLTGDPEQLAAPQLAIIGSRNPTFTGEEIAFEIAHALAEAGVTVTSGLALGIDSAGHRGALAATGAGRGVTYAVLGTGVDRIYPASHLPLAQQIVAAGGAILSEFCVGTAPHRGNFPRRNRIISGLTLGTVVVEATLKSGSLITARSALDQGREVFAVPGSVRNPQARGCHLLLRQGAKLVENASDILQDLAPQLAQLLQQEMAIAHSTAPAQQGSALPAEEARLVAAVGDEVTSVDTIIARSGLTSAQVSSMLLPLELQGHIRLVAGGYLRTKLSRESERK